MIDKTHILALDLGTSNSRSIVFDAQGHIVSMAQRELRQIYPRPGWVEHDPLELWDTQLAIAHEALARAGLKASEVAAIGITHQRETTVVWSRLTRAPLYNAHIWQDRRAEPTCAAFFDTVPGARAAAHRGELAFGTVGTWLMWQLTGGQVHATDVSNASRTLLLSVRANEWDDELLGLLDIPREVLPVVHPSSHPCGSTRAAIFGAAIPIGASHRHAGVRARKQRLHRRRRGAVAARRPACDSGQRRSAAVGRERAWTS